VPSVLWYCWLGLLTCRNRRPYNLYCVYFVILLGAFVFRFRACLIFMPLPFWQCWKRRPPFFASDNASKMMNKIAGCSWGHQNLRCFSSLRAPSSWAIDVLMPVDTGWGQEDIATLCDTWVHRAVRQLSVACRVTQGSRAYLLRGTVPWEHLWVSTSRLCEEQADRQLAFTGLCCEACFIHHRTYLVLVSRSPLWAPEAWSIFWPHGIKGLRPFALVCVYVTTQYDTIW